MSRTSALLTFAAAALLALAGATLLPGAEPKRPAPPTTTLPAPVREPLEEVAPTVQLDGAVAFVERAMAGITATAPTRRPRAYTATVAAMQFVQSRVSSAIYAARGANAEGLPGIDAEQALALQAGICGQHVEVFLRILERLGVEAQPVQFFFVADGVRQSHVAAEVRWGGRWHYVDVTYGAVFPTRDGRLRSLAEVLDLRRPMRHAQVNALDAWTDAAVQRGWDPYNYLRRASHRDVVRLGAGTVRPPLAADDTGRGARAYELTLLPDYVGTSTSYGGDLVTVSMRLAVPAGGRALTLDVRAVSCAAGGTVTLRRGRRTVSRSLTELPAAGPVVMPIGGARSATLAVEPAERGSGCAIMLDGLSVSTAGDA